MEKAKKLPNGSKLTAVAQCNSILVSVGAVDEGSMETRITPSIWIQFEFL